MISEIKTAETITKLKQREPINKSISSFFLKIFLAKTKSKNKEKIKKKESFPWKKLMLTFLEKRDDKNKENKKTIKRFFGIKYSRLLKDSIN